MAPPILADRDETGVGSELPSGVYREPIAGTVISVILTLASLAILSVFISVSSPRPSISSYPHIRTDPSPKAQRSLAIKVWSRLPYVVWRT